MNLIFKYFFIGLKYLILQGIVEVIVITAFEYLGFNVLGDFSKSNLLIENIEGIAWAISMKTLVLSLFYLPLFVIVSYLVKSKTRVGCFAFSIINMALSIVLLALFILIRSEAKEMIRPVVASLSASLIIAYAGSKRPKSSG